MLYTSSGYRRSFVSSYFIFSDLILRTFFSKTVKLSIIEYWVVKICYAVLQIKNVLSKLIQAKGVN